MSDSPTTGASGRPETGPQLPEFVDWIAGILIALAGGALTVGGSVLAFLVDRDALEAGVESGEITVVVVERELTEAEALEVTEAVVSWAGWGLLVTGIGLLLFAVGYVAARHRAHSRTPGDESAGTFQSAAVLGAVTAGVLSFLPFSPAIGGGVAGYLEGGSGRGVGVGALSGFLAIAPVLLVLVFVTVGLYDGLATVGDASMGIVVAAAMLFAFLFTAAFGTGLGALGGFVGGRLGNW
jgi:hypothetical protein